jgi:hypothetical protein
VKNAIITVIVVEKGTVAARKKNMNTVIVVEKNTVVARKNMNTVLVAEKNIVVARKNVVLSVEKEIVNVKSYKT